MIGVGALCSPLVATQFAQQHRWSFHYLTSLGVALANTIALIVVFRFKDQDCQSTFILYLVPRLFDASSFSLAAALAEIGQVVVHNDTAEEHTGSKYSQMFKLKSLHLMAVFILIYVGVEVTLGGGLGEFVSALALTELSRQAGLSRT